MIVATAPVIVRLPPLLWLGMVFVAVFTLSRLVFLVEKGSGVPVSVASPLYSFSVGLGYGLLTFFYFAWPLVLVLLLLPRRWLARRWGSALVAVLCLVLLIEILFVEVRIPLWLCAPRGHVAPGVLI